MHFMKKLLPIFCCCTLNYTFSQTPFIVSVAQDDLDEIFSVTEVADGYIGTGFARCCYEDIKLSKIGFNGQVIWNKVINGAADYNVGNAIVKTSDGGFAIIAGSVSPDYPNISDISDVLKFDSEGVLQWTKQYGGGPGNALLQSSDNGFLIATLFGYLIKTDSIGNHKWSEYFRNIESIDDVQRTIDHNYILLSGENTDSSVSAIKIDTAGKILWSKTFTAAGHQFHGAAVLSISEGGYLITGTDFFESTNYGFIIKLDSLGNILWSKLVNAGENNSSLLVNAVETNKKDFVLGGTFYDYQYNVSYYLIRIDGNGTLIWTKIFGSGFYQSIAKLIPTSDGGYLAVGDGNYSAEDGVFIKLDSGFNTCEPIQNIGSVETLSISNKNLTVSAVSSIENAYNSSLTVSSTGFVANICGVLPVNLVAFNAELQKNYVQVNWQTVTETNTSYFNIQRSTNGVNFTNIDRATAAGNSNAVHNYTYSDTKIADIGNISILYYRLQTVDADGALTVSKIVPVRIPAKPVSLLAWPNPVKDKLQLRMPNFTGNAIVHIYDVAGKVVYNSTTTTYNTDMIINTANLKAGTYFLQVNADGLMLKQKFTKE